MPYGLTDDLIKSSKVGESNENDTLLLQPMYSYRFFQFQYAIRNRTPHQLIKNLQIKKVCVIFMISKRYHYE